MRANTKTDALKKWFSQSPARWLIPATILFFATFAVYLPALNGDFIWDDDFYITKNPLLTKSEGLLLLWHSQEDIPSQFFPLTYALFWIQYRLWGLDPLGYHMVNVAIHILNAIFVWLLLLRLKIPGAWMAALIFALHPVHVESVAWMTELKNVLSAVFYLLSALFFLKFLNEEKARFYIISVILFILSLLSKTVTLTLPAALFLIMWMQGFKMTWKNLRLLVPFFAVGLFMGLFTCWWEAYHQGSMGEQFNFSFLQRVIIAGRAVWFYFLKLIWPVNLTFSYPRWELNPGDIRNYTWHLGLIIIGLILWSMKKIWGRGPLAGVAFFIVTLSPMLGFFNYYTMRYSFVADHYQYLASIGMIALIVGGGFFLLESAGKYFQWISADRTNKIKLITGITTAVFFGMLTYHQSGVYRNQKILWEDVIAKNHRSWMAHDNLGNLLIKEGLINEAIMHFKQALTIKPDCETAQNNLANALSMQGLTQEAIPHYLEALRIRPNYAKAQFNLGLAYYRQGNIAEAIKSFQSVLQINPDHREARKNLFLLQSKINE